jgi:hypothetical protein
MAELLPITDYASLKAAVLAMSDNNNAEYADSIPLFIQQAESKLFQHLRCPGNEKRGTWFAVDGDNTVGVAIPEDYLEVKLAFYGTCPLERITDQRLAVLSAAEPAPGAPRYFARVIDTLNFYPVGDANDDVNVVYYEFQGPLSDTLTWTKMLRIDPFAYLYGALAEGARFMRDADEEARWQGLFDASVNKLNAQAMDNEVAGSTVVVSDLGGGW